MTQFLCDVAGGYFVAAELSRRGYLASITLRNSRGVDILATNRDATKSVAIQVKTNQRGLAEWILNEKVEATPGGDELPENLFFVFVNLPPNGDPPSYHVISRREVARLVKEGHAAWLSTPGRGGKARATNNPFASLKTLPATIAIGGICSGSINRLIDTRPTAKSEACPHSSARSSDVR